MELISVIGIVVGFLFLLAFFKMASDVSSMKDMLKAQSTAHYKTAFYVHLTNKDTAQATEALLSLVFADLMQKDYTERQRYHLFEEKKVEYEPLFTQLGAPYPTNPFKNN